MHTTPIWAQTAKLAFNLTKGEDFVKKAGAYDKLIINCGFREDLRKMKFHDSHGGGCEGFYPSLTSNGMCYTFNGMKTSDLWRPSDIITTFSNLFPSNSESHKNFGGSRSVQGSKKTNHNIQFSTIAYVRSCNGFFLLSIFSIIWKQMIPNFTALK